MNHQRQLKAKVENQVKRMQKAEKERPHLLAQTAYVGTLGLILVLPIVGGAYLGLWLDGLVMGYSLRWTLSFIFLGLLIGCFNVYFFIRDNNSN
jgi:ATP synthase protein I